MFYLLLSSFHLYRLSFLSFIFLTFFSFSLSFFNYSTVFISIHNFFHVYTSESIPHLTSSLFILHEEKNKNGCGCTKGEAAGLAGSSLLLEMLLRPFLCKGGISQFKVQHPGLSLLLCQILLSPCWITYSTQLESVTKFPKSYVSTKTVKLSTKNYPSFDQDGLLT